MFFENHDFETAISPDAPEKTGPARFFEIFQEECTALFQLNLLFLISCLPLFTIPPAIYAMHYVTRRMVLNQSGRCSHYYWTAFKQLWKQAYGAFFATALPLFFAGFGALFYLRGAAKNSLLFAPFMLCSTVFLVTLLSSTYLYGLLTLNIPLRKALRPAVILGLSKPLRAILAALSIYGSVLISVLAFPLSSVYLFLIGFSLPFLLANFFLRTVLHPYAGS